MSVHDYPDLKHCTTQKEVETVYFQVNAALDCLNFDQLGTILSAYGVVPAYLKSNRIKQLTVLLQLR